MCGIAGIIGEGYSQSDIERMTEMLHHRGPDDGGVWVHPGVVMLGHRRLSILDLTDAGRQPMTFGNYTIVFNGEIYNYRELRKELEGPFVSNSDTEVLLHLYARYGDRCVEKLRGMFAFAIWDANKRMLFAARDRWGIKPFYYRILPHGLAFASELKAIKDLGPVNLDRTALVDYLTYKYVPAPKSIYSEIKKLPSAHTITFKGTTKIENYWTAGKVEVGKYPEETLNELLKEAITQHTLADVPVGLFLSGGLDSSTLAAFLDQPESFTIGFDIPSHSEVSFARIAADCFGTQHHERIVSIDDVEGALEALPGMFDEPFGDSAAWPTYLVSQLARERVKVVLSGEGGDEVFSGYGWYGKFLEITKSRTAKLLAHALPVFSSAGQSMYRRGSDEVERYAALVGLFTVPQVRSLLTPDFWDRDYDPLWYIRKYWRMDLDPIKRMQWVDLHTYLPDDLLVKVDRASMAVSLEVRPPFLDHHLVEFALSLKTPMLRRGKEGKVILRAVMNDRLPKEIVSRPKKGFSMPVKKWIDRRPNLIEGALDRLARQGILRSKRRPRLDGEQLWSLLVLDRWVQHAKP